MENVALKILLIEDNLADARFIRELLIEDSPEVMLIVQDTLGAAEQYLKGASCDLVLLDLNLPDTNGIETLERLNSRYADIPIIILTGLSDKELAVDAIQKGAQDYLVKGEFSRDLLVRSMQYAVERKKLLRKLEDTIREINTLKGLLPICAYCKKIRDDKGAWNNMEVYISERSGAEFSHGICPSCARQHFGT